MILKIKDRLYLLKLLYFKQSGGVLELMHVANIRSKVAVTVEDEAKYDMKETDGKTSWSLEKDTGEEYDLTAREIEVIKGIIKEVSKTDIEVTPEDVDLYLKFIDINELEQ